jgi:hypothetical protein
MGDFDNARHFYKQSMVSYEKGHFMENAWKAKGKMSEMV